MTMMMTSSRVAIALVIALASACAPSPADGRLQCNTNGSKACPDGYYCASGSCWKNGHSPDLGMAMDDLSTVDAAIDVDLIGADLTGADFSTEAIDQSLPDDLTGADLLQSIDASPAHDLATPDDLKPIMRTLTVTIQGPGSGTVSGGGISCTALGGTCTVQVADGTVINLAAAPADANNAFTGWSGDCTGTTTPCALTVTGGNKNVTGKFAPVFDLSVIFQKSSDCGTSSQAYVGVSTSIAGYTEMNCYSCANAAFECHAKFVAGSSFTITATPGTAGTPCGTSSGTATLANPAMTGGCTANTSGGGFSTSPASCILTMDSNKSMTVFTCQQSG